jgi:predicted small lipoprotein YifL
MKKFISVTIVAGMLAGLSACGDKKDSADKAAEAQKAIQEGMQKEKSMVEGMMKAGEKLEKEMTEKKEETKK